MLTTFPQGGQRKPIWLDLHDATAAEQAEAAALAGVDLPSRDSLSEIENSSRLRARDDVLSISIPMISRMESGATQVTPVGFVLSRSHLVTIRFAALHAFDAVAARFGEAGFAPASLELFVTLFEEIVDRLADGLEAAAAELSTISAATFQATDEAGHQAIRSNRVIRAKLHHLGRLGERLSEVRDALLGVGRAVNFTGDLPGQWHEAGLEPRMRSLQQDVASLDDYQVHLSDKVQFLLDAMVGLIGIAQNDVFKVLTIVSIAGIPPTLIAGIYGMNFKLMPEYNWSFGYPYALAVIALSGLAPLAWFKWRGWF